MQVLLCAPARSFARLKKQQQNKFQCQGAAIFSRQSRNGPICSPLVSGESSRRIAGRAHANRVVWATHRLARPCGQGERRRERERSAHTLGASVRQLSDLLRENAFQIAAKFTGSQDVLTLIATLFAPFIQRSLPARGPPAGL